MAAEDEIDLAPDVSAPPDWLNPTTTPAEKPKEDPGALSDYGNALAAGAFNTVAGVAGAADYIGRLTDEAAGRDHNRQIATDVREWADEKGQAAVGRMSEARRRAANAGWLPGSSNSMWNDDTSLLESLALKTTMSLPSLIASVLPAGVVGRAMLALGSTAEAAAVAGTAAGAASNAAQSGGGVFDQIESEYRNMSDKDLRSQVEMYDELRKRGMSEQEARDQLVKYAVGAKPFLMAAVTAGTSAFGVEGLAAGLVAGTLKKGVARNAIKGAAGEAAQETIESGVESVLNQQGTNYPKGKDINWIDVLDQAIQGGVTGGVLGGVTGGVLGHGHEENTKDRNKEKAKPDDLASPATGNDGGAEPPQPGSPPQTAPDGTPAIPLAGEEQTPPAGSPTPAAPALEEDIQFADDELGDPSVTAALKPTPQVSPDAPTVDVDVASTTRASAQPTTTVDSITNDIVAETAQQAPQPAPAPVARQQQLPTEGMPQAEAAPTAAPQVEPVAQSAPQEQPPGPRVLQSETEAAQRAEAAWRERLAEERARLRAEGELPTQTRIRDTNAIDGDGVAKMDRRKWIAAAKRIMDAQGDNTPAAVLQTVRTAQQADGMAPKDPRRVAINQRIDDLQQKAAEHYRSVATERASAVSQNFDSREATVAKTEGQSAKARQALKKRADRSSDAAKNVVTNTDSAPEEMVSDVNVRSKAVADRLEAIVRDAQSNGVSIPTRVTSETPLYQNVLKRYQEAARNIRARRTPKGYENFADYVADVQTDELMARKGRPEEVAERFRIEGDTRGDTGAQIADDTFVDQSPNVDDTSHDEVVTREERQEAAAETSEEGSQPVREQTPVARRREKVEDDGVAAVYGGAKKAPVVEQRKSRTINKPSEADKDTAFRAIANAANKQTEAKQITERLIADAPAEARERLTKAHKEFVKSGGYSIVAQGLYPDVVERSAAIRAAKDVVQGKPAQPTPAQAAAGNYKKKHIYPFGLNVTVETAKGQTRSGVGPDGEPWSVKSPADYGYVKRTTGADGEQIDVYVGPYRDIRNAPTVFVVNQMDPATGEFDEHKAMVGFKDEDEAIDAYVSGFSDDSGGSRIKSVDVMSVDEFRQWLKRPQQAEASTGTTILPSEDWTMVDTTPEPVAPAGPQFNTTDDAVKAASRVTTVGNTIALERIRSGNSLNIFNRSITAPVAEAVRKVAGDVRVLFMSPTDMFRFPSVQHSLATGVISSAPAGFYEPNHDIIVINSAYRDRITPEEAMQLIVHEGLHAALSSTIKQAPQAAKQLSELRWAVMDQVDRMRAAGILDDQRIYGLTNNDEFISEAMSNPDFQALLASIKVPAEMNEGPLPQTFWDRFVSFARSVLSFVTGNNVESNALEAAMRSTANLFEITNYVGRRNETGMAPLFSPVPGSVQDHARATAGWMRRTGYRFATLDYIRQMNKGLFVDKAGDALDKVVSTMQKITPYARSLQEPSQKLAVDFINWGTKNLEHARAMADLAIEATMMNVNLVDSNDPAALAAANTHLGKDAMRGWQAKAGLADMQRRFMKLPPEARALWQKQADYYRDTQNKVARATIDSLLEAVADKLTPQQRNDLADKTMAGTLGDADKQLLGNNAVFNNLKDALVLRKINGVYFPLMRYGENVVTTRLKWGDMMGGKEIAHNQIEFRAPKDKDARAQARAYVQKTDIPVTSVKRVFYDRQTGQQLNLDDAKGRDVDVGYRVNVQRDGVFMFDTMSEAEQFRRENADEFHSMSGVMPKADYNQNNTLTAGQLSALMSAVRNMSDDKVSPARKLEVEQALHQAAARMLPGNRIQKRSIKRKNTVGASADLPRALLNYGQASSGYLARAKYMPELRDGLARMRAIQADKTEISSQAVQRSLTLHTITDRIAGNVEKVYTPNSFVQGLLTLSFLDKLASPAYSLLNAMQVMMTTYPYLAGKHGETNAALQLSRAYQAIGLGNITLDGLGNTYKAVRQIKAAALDTRDVHGSIRERIAKEKDGKQLTAVLDELQSRGMQDDAAVFELAQSIERGHGRTMTALSRVDRIARQLPSAIEQMNRSVAAIAAYRLATQQGKSHEEAMQAAFDTTSLTQFDYSNVNSPTIFNNGVARVALQFKKYAANMAVLLYDMTQRAFKGTTLEERRIGRRQLANLVGMQMLTAGALSLPGLELLKVFGLISGVLGMGGSYDDLERWMRKVLKDKIGAKPSEMLLYGASRGLGVDLSSRLSLADMFLFGEPKEFNQDGYQAYLFRLIAGAPGGYASDLIAATNNVGDGDYAKAIEKIIPMKIIADTQRAVTKYRAGDYNAAEAGAQAFGLRPASAARASDEIGDAIAKRKDQQEQRRRLEKRYINSSPADRKVLEGKIKEYNKDANWREKISFGALNRRIKAMDDKRAGRFNPDNEPKN